MFKNYFPSFVALMVFSMVAAGQALALDLTSFSLADAVADVGTIATAVLLALTAMWGARKVVKLINRS